MSDDERRILEFLRDVGSATGAVIGRWACPGRSHNWAYRHARNLEKEGLIYRDGGARFHLSLEGLARLWKEQDG